MSMKLTISTTLLVLMLMASLASAGEADLTAEESQNKQLIEWVFAEGVNNQNLNAFDSALADDYVRYCDAMPEGAKELHGAEAMKGFLVWHFAAFPDWNEQIQQMVIRDDKIAVISIGTGVMTGGFGPFEATGKTVKITNIMIFRFEKGRIAESWITWDNVHFLTQLGLFPPPAPLEKQTGK